MINIIINDKADIVYPYQCGIYQWCADFNMEIFSEFVKSWSGTAVLDKNKRLSNSTIGWCQFIDRQKYIDSYMMNENFVSWGCEDDEFYFRMSTLGNRIGRINDYVYHLEHARGENSWFSNPHMQSNMSEWDKIQSMSKNNLLQYYSEQEYLKKYAGI